MTKETQNQPRPKVSGGAAALGGAIVFVLILIGLAVKARVEADSGDDEAARSLVLGLMVVGSVFVPIAIAVAAYAVGIYMPASILREELRRENPNAVIFSLIDPWDLDEVPWLGLSASSRYWLSVGVTVNSDGWRLWRGVRRPREVGFVPIERLERVSAKEELIELFATGQTMSLSSRVARQNAFDRRARSASAVEELAHVVRETLWEH